MESLIKLEYVLCKYLVQLASMLATTGVEHNTPLLQIIKRFHFIQNKHHMNLKQPAQEAEVIDYRSMTLNSFEKYIFFQLGSIYNFF